jgi:hypothetical protein
MKRTLDNYNVLLVTMDSCRFDSAARAHTPVLDELGPLRRAITPGTFTLPAHMAFFSGYLPNVIEWPLADYYSRQKFQLWRLSRAKEKPRDTYGFLLEGDTILEGFRNAGYGTVGAGGVRWFLTKTLTGQFDEFHFWGPRDYSEWFALRNSDDFALNHVDELAGAVASHDRWFLFVNCLETHAPYNNGADGIDPEVQDVIGRGEPIWAGRTVHDLATCLSDRDFKLLHRAQIRAVEIVDQRLGVLIERLPRPFIVVVCGDHGEAFGEEGRWGHGFPADPVTHVPMVVGFVE